MTTINTLSRQPTKLDYASPTQFKFQITKLPKVEYFCTAVNIPGIDLGGIISQVTPLKDIPLPGEKLTYNDLTMTFLIDENLENYREIHGWMTGLGFPQDRKQYRTLIDAAKDRFPTEGKDSLTNHTIKKETDLIIENENPGTPSKHLFDELIKASILFFFISI